MQDLKFHGLQIIFTKQSPEQTKKKKKKGNGNGTLTLCVFKTYN